ncbi:SURF1 family cytochrome oxidase biogenesis protein [Serinicoccus kebangsaanensis]|uniref:SURF1 family cytochrome oxidase biogenesis protein n=1 Tax=Serinicoccus kebangsaanensis TaxID=2602069 RepID=UPI00124DDED0|nr:SURF1 family protein [Serinicoccus kebangsaanensis]
MWQVLRRPRWVGYLALALLFGVITAGLGTWQWQRHESKVERRAVVEANYDSAPVPLDDALPVGSDLTEPQRWTRVRATGTYLTEDQHLVRNRPHQGVYGYEVLVPLSLDDGTTLAVDRGWVPNAPTAAQLPEVPPAPGGEVTVTGWLLPSEADLGLDPVEGQLPSVDLDGLARATGLQVRGAYLVLDTEDPAAQERPEPRAEPDTGLGAHLPYALQWWLTVPVGVILVVVMARREARDEGLVQARRTTGSEPRKVRIWDEEDA